MRLETHVNGIAGEFWVARAPVRGTPIFFVCAVLLDSTNQSAGCPIADRDVDMTTRNKAIQLALDEVVSDVIKYASTDRVLRERRIRITVFTDEVKAQVVADAFRVLPAPHPAARAGAFQRHTTGLCGHLYSEAASLQRQT